MGGQKWYLRTHVLVIVFILLATMLASLLLLLLLLLPSRSEVLAVMQWRMINARVFRLETEIEYQSEAERLNDQDQFSYERESYRLTTTGAIDRTDSEAVRQAHSFTLGFVPDQKTDQQPYVISGEWRTISNESYLRMWEVTKSFGSLLASGLTNRWLHAKSSDLCERVTVPVVGLGCGLSVEDNNYLIDEFRRTPFLSVVRRLDDETLNGIEAFHYEVEPEMLLIRDFLITSGTLRRGREPSKEELRSFDKYFSSLKADGGEAWIGRNDYYLYRLRLHFLHDDGTRTGRLSLIINFSNFNQPLTLAEPDGETSEIGAIIASLLSDSSGGLSPAEVDDRSSSDRSMSIGTQVGLPASTMEFRNADSDGDGLNNQLEIFFGSDPYNPDSDGDGMNDGDEVAAGQDPGGAGKLFDFGISSSLEAADTTGTDQDTDESLR
ncbi:hypothetical protein A2480_00200 [Candidatus Uhrbacteria bacterium RIFOXYC2_FULL_47_19]|uniref:Uncharacterized protein n=1 Tax=Candidatus Uhrbacteria bacterium RIFOXYC2_FULL_47_19 TaxID=1802424 RepID=A0A1F7WDJ4_9BACT|nr:MAG: hypothetical protein A2480_00200 [Candidatus Uhrbacteria bacterium RIFOXYC2_FULL_47_19]